MGGNQCLVPVVLRLALVVLAGFSQCKVAFPVVRDRCRVRRVGHMVHRCNHMVRVVFRPLRRRQLPRVRAHLRTSVLVLAQVLVMAQARAAQLQPLLCQMVEI